MWRCWRVSAWEGGKIFFPWKDLWRAHQAWGGQLIINYAKMGVHPLHELVTRFSHRRVKVLLKYSRCNYPLSYTNASLSAAFHYPLHAACFSLKAKIDSVESSLREEDVAQTLRVLLKHSFEPNERCEDPGLRCDLDPTYGFAPLQILERVALRAQRAGIHDVCSIAERCAHLRSPPPRAS